MYFLFLLTSNSERHMLSELYMKHRKKMFHIANRILKNPQIAENVVHDSFINIMNNIDKFTKDNIDKHAGLIYIIVKRQALNELKRIKRIDYNDALDAEVEYSESGSIEDAIITKELFEEATSIIRTMDEKYSSVLMLTSRGYSIEEISKLLEISADTVRQRLHRARMKVKNALPKEMKTDD